MLRLGTCLTCCLLAVCFLFPSFITAQKSLLQSGPMLGYAEMREVLIWVQTKETAEVKIGYTELGSGKGPLFTDTYATLKSEGYTAKLIADQVQPGKTYTYQVYINEQAVELPYPTRFTTPPIWKWRNDPPNFTVALGSCTYVNEARYDRPGKGYGSEYEIFTSIDKKNPNLMIWLGDNMYLREPDWYTRTGILHRYTHTRSLPEMQPLLARTHHYATWDDHDYGPNNSDRGWVHKDLVKEVFDRFWGNLSSGLPGETEDPGITSMFRYNDVDFFLLDNRSFRTANDQVQEEGKTVLGEDQLEWLIDNLIFSNASYKMVCIGGQVLNTVERFETYINLAPQERQYLLDRINEENIENVIFLTGDRHHTELSSLTLPNGKKVYDITISSLTAGTGRNRNEVNDNRVEGTLTVQHNFGLLEFSGPEKDRKLMLRVCDKDGETLWIRRL
ncbi:MAG: alkaline phosphatase D family protein [Bacteroidota bacterium]